GSVPPVISTAPARSPGQPAIGKSVRRASLVMVATPGYIACSYKIVGALISIARGIRPPSPRLRRRRGFGRPVPLPPDTSLTAPLPPGETGRQHITVRSASTSMLYGTTAQKLKAFGAQRKRIYNAPHETGRHGATRL